MRAATTVGAGFTIAFGPRQSGYLQADSHNAFAEFHTTSPVEGGLGYRLAAGMGNIERQQVQLDWRSEIGQVSVEAARDGGDTGIVTVTY